MSHYTPTRHDPIDDSVRSRFPHFRDFEAKGWKFFVEEYNDPHNGDPEEDFYFQSPRMLTVRPLYQPWQPKTFNDTEVRCAALDVVDLFMKGDHYNGDLHTKLINLVEAKIGIDKRDPSTLKLSINIE